MKTPASVLAMFLAATVSSFAAASPQCSIAVFGRQLAPNTQACDQQTVTRLAREGHAYEQNQLGLASMLVVDRNSDMRDAVAWFQKAAQRGYAPAQVNLAVIYENGWGVPQNYGTALHWLQEAAAQKYPAAYYNLGELFFKGAGVKQDYTEAARYFQLGADAGDSYAQTNLGYLYDRGLGVPRNLDTAIVWYKKAAEAGNPMAESNLADLYARGEGVPKDADMAFHLFEDAAQKGHTGAQIQLAYRFAYGVGTAKNPEKALAWVTAASLSGDGRGNELLHSLRSQLKSAEVKHATQDATELRASSQQAARSGLLQP